MTATQAPIVVRRLDRGLAFSGVPAHWNVLADRSQTATVFQTREWLDSWWKHFGAGAEPLVLIAERGGEWVGAAPLLIKTHQAWSGNRRQVAWIGAPHADYCDLIVDRDCPEAADALLGWLASHANDWDVVDLLNTPCDALTTAALPAKLQRRGYPLRTLATVDAPSRVFQAPDAERKAIDKKSLRPLLNGFKREGTVEFRHLTSSTEIYDFLDVLFDQHIQRWADSATPSPFRGAAHREFYRDLVTAFEPSANLVFSAMLVNGVAIACHFGFEYRGRFHYYKPTYDAAYHKRSPGSLLLQALMERALDRGLREFDFGVGDEPYKYRFANHIRTCANLRIYRYTLHYHAQRSLASLRDAARRSPSLVRIKRRLAGGTRAQNVE